MHVGIDVSKSTINAAFRSDGGWQSMVFGNDSKGFEGLLEWAGSGKRFSMEATGGYHVELALALHAAGAEVSVLNPLSVKNYSRARLRRAKTDAADAQTIADFAERFGGEIPLWEPCGEMVAQARAVVGQLELLKTTRTTHANSIESQKLTPAGRASAQIVAPLLEYLDAMLKALEKRLLELVEGFAKDSFGLLQTIPGIGPKTAAVLLAATDGFRPFPSASKVSAYFGMCPRIFESGSSVRGKGHICKMGFSYVRAYLYMCAVASQRCNEGCRAFYCRLVEKGKPKKVAFMAVANKLLRIAFAVVKSGKPWNPSLAPVQG